MFDEPRWISEADVAELMSMADAIDVLADSYRLELAGGASSMRRAHVRSGESILHAVGGTLAGRDLAGTKTWTYTPGGAAPLVILFSLLDGSVQAIIEAFALGQMRTAATSGLGTRTLAPAGARTLAVLGTGKQAFAQAHAVTLVRPIEAIRLFGRDAERRAALAGRLADELGVGVSEHADPAEAITGADVVTAITRSAEPFVTGDMLHRGQHVNAVGAIVPSRRELDASAVARCRVIVADSVVQARDDAGELRAAVEAGGLDWHHVHGLAEVVDRPLDDLRRSDDISLFKALGVGLSDVALGAEIALRAQDADVGRPLPRPAAAHH